VITDYASNLKRLEKIITSLDQPNANDPVVIPLQYASAVDVAATVNRLFTEASQRRVRRTDASFLGDCGYPLEQSAGTFGDPSRLTQLRKFVTMLDSPTNAGGNIHVVYLKNAEATKLAETLRAIYQGDGGATVALRTTAALGTSAPTGASQPWQLPPRPASFRRRVHQFNNHHRTGCDLQ